MIQAPPWLWGAFTAGVLALLALDLGLVHRKPQELQVREALGWTAFWVCLALLFNAWVWYAYGSSKAVEFLTGYLLEESLSVDNIFVFVMLFAYFQVPVRYQRTVLFWGILGALILRFAMIVAGTALIARVHWAFHAFGALLIATGAKMALAKEGETDVDKNPITRLLRRFLPMTKEYHGGRFLVAVDGRRFATPLLLVLIVVELMDVMFALDSIPAVFGVTTDPFIVYTSNVCAILGLRSLFFVLSGALDLFHHLKTGVSLVLVFIGAKMCASDLVHVPIGASLGVIATILGISMAASLLRPRNEGGRA